jgi:hypothetical protein
MEKVKDIEQEPVEPAKEEILPVKKQGRIGKSVSRVLGGEILSRKSVLNNLTFLVYMALLAMLYIANTYYAEKTFKNIERIKNELKEYRFQYITAKSALMFNSQQSEIAKRASLHGLKITTLPPYKIFYKSVSAPGADSSQKKP